MSMTLTDSANRILDVAEVSMRRAGYNAVSYRDIASEVGIKSASLHYHFPKKEDLGVALVKRYAMTFSERLNENIAGLKKAEEKLAVFVELYEIALFEHRLICLCAVLGAEAQGLPDVVTTEVRAFFTDNISWLTAVFSEMGARSPEKIAKSTLSLLEGAMIVSSVNADDSIFAAAAQLILSGCYISQ